MPACGDAGVWAGASGGGAACSSSWIAASTAVSSCASVLRSTVPAGAVSAWTRRFPTRRLHLVEGRSEDLRRQVLAGAIDLAVVDGDAPQAGLTVRPLSRETMVAVGLARSGLLPAGQLAQEVLWVGIAQPQLLAA